MKLKILFQNVRGLNDPSAIDNLRNYIQRDPVDILFIQEHKLRGSSALNIGKMLWKRATSLVTEAEQGYTATGGSAGKGGLLTLVSPKWSNLISQSGSILGGKAQWFIFSKIQGGDLGFIHVYAPCNSLAVGTYGKL